jgi:hypothetical protein
MIWATVAMACTTVNVLLLLILQAGKIHRLEAEVYLLRNGIELNNLQRSLRILGAAQKAESVIKS